jgi:hypothetical protein
MDRTCSIYRGDKECIQNFIWEIRMKEITRNTEVKMVGEYKN